MVRHAAAIEMVVKKVFEPQLISLKNQPWRQRFLVKWRVYLQRFLPLEGASHGNKVTIFNCGDEAFAKMWESIGQAQQRVFMQTYTLKPDSVGGKTLLELATARRERGCDVKLMYDYAGSPSITDDDLRPLRSTGAEVIVFNPLLTWPWKIVHNVWYRNHIKLLVVDDNVGFCGGMNLADEYAGTASGGTGYFRDTQLKVEGPAVKDLEHVFLATRHEASEQAALLSYSPPGMSPEATTPAHHEEEVDDHEEEEHEAADEPVEHQSDSTSTAEPGDEDVFVQVLQSNVRRNRRHIQKAMRGSLHAANSRCYLTTPYFLPPLLLTRALVAAAQRGVDVRLLTCGPSDVPLLRLATQHIYHRFLESGVRIYEYNGKTLHAKTVTIDGVYSSVGSFNLDPHSDSNSLEVNVTILDTKTAETLENHFFQDLAQSSEVTQQICQRRPLYLRFVHWAVYQILRILWPSMPH